MNILGWFIIYGTNLYICVFLSLGLFSNYLLYKSFTYIQIGLTFFCFSFISIITSCILDWNANILETNSQELKAERVESSSITRGTMGSLSALTEHRALVIQLNYRDPWVGIYLLQIYLLSKVEEQSLKTLRLLPLSQISLQEILSILAWTTHFFSSHPPPDRILHSLALSSLSP